MLLVDREIAALGSGLLEDFSAECVTNIGYDLRAEQFIADGQTAAKAVLAPGESVFVGTKEKIKLPDDMTGRIVLKNSRIRQGFSMDAPVYQPGHHTRVFFRLTNVSGDELRLNAGEKYTTILFERLSGPPDSPYKGTFTNELDFSGMGQYGGVYQAQVRKLEKKTEDLKSLERSIYANVLVILTVFVALFSFITTNLSLLSASADARQFLIYNFMMLGCISFLVALLNGVISFAKSYKIPWAASVLSFAVAILLFLIK